MHLPHGPQNIPLALAIMVLASLFFATGATLQHLVVGGIIDHQAENKTMGARQLWRMVTNVRWLGALLIVATGAVLHIIAITMAPVVVVQPVGILAVPWSILMAARLHRHHINARMWLAVAVTVSGIVMFTALAASNAAPDRQTAPRFVLLGALVVYAAGTFFGALAWKGRSALWRCLFWATGGSFFYGLSSALIKATSVMLREPGFLGSWWFYLLVPMLIGSYVIGGLMIQQGYACGPAEVVVGSMDTTDPIVGVGFGLIVLGEGVLISPPEALAMVVAALIAVSGVVILSRNHPNATNEHAAALGSAAA